MDNNNLSWHDGNLVNTSFQIDLNGCSEIIVTAKLYESAKSSVRKAYKIICKDVVKYHMTIDTIELKDNMLAGNISNGYLKSNILWLYFTDGLLEVNANKFELIEC